MRKGRKRIERIWGRILKEREKEDVSKNKKEMEKE